MDEHAQALVFFRTLFTPDDVIELRPIDASGDADVARGKSWPQTVEEAAELAFAHSAQGWNAYVGTFPRRERGRSDGSDAIAAMTSVWCEIDWLKLVQNADRDIKNGTRTLENALAEGKAHSDATLAALPVPTLVVASGAGYHPWWVLRERLALDSDDARARAQALLRAANVRAGGDKTVHDLARVLRVPGTTNFPNRRKRALGRGPVPTSLIHVREDAQYTLEELEEAFGATAPDIAAITVATNGATASPANGSATTAPTPPVDSDFATLHANAKLLAIWNGPPLDGDRSNVIAGSPSRRFATASGRTWSSGSS